MSERRAEFADRLRQHQTALFGYIVSLVRDFDDADDLFQATSLRSGRNTTPTIRAAPS